MSFAKKFSRSVSLITLSLALCVQACARDLQKGDQAPSPSPPPAPSGGGPVVPEGWQRFSLDGGAGDRISVLLPQEPEEHPGGKFKVSPEITLPAKVFLVARDARVYLTLFVDLPKDAGALTADERGEIFFGCWRGAAESVREVLEEKLGGPVEITPARQLVGEIKGGERRMQDFKIGPQNGRAQAMFLGRRVYMLVAVRDPVPEAEQDASRFLESFQVHRDGK